MRGAGKNVQRVGEGAGEFSFYLWGKVGGGEKKKSFSTFIFESVDAKSDSLAQMCSK